MLLVPHKNDKASMNKTRRAEKLWLKGGNYQIREDATGVGWNCRMDV